MRSILSFGPLTWVQRASSSGFEGPVYRDLVASVSRQAGLWAVSGSRASAMELAARFLLDRLDLDTVVIGMVERGGLVVSSWTGPLGDAAGRRVRDEVELGGQSVFAAAVASGNVVRVEGHEAAEEGFGEGTCSLLTVPLVVGDLVIGVLGLESRTAGGVPLDGFTALALGSAVGLALDYVRVVERGEKSLRETVTVLAALVEARDSYTESHCVVLAEMGLALGMRMGLSPERLQIIMYAGLLHDIGKVSVPDKVLLKPGPLTSAEFATMKTHAEVGESVLAGIGAFGEVAPVVGQHHERFDGSGYPRGLKGDGILLEARILAVVDAFDAMTSTRPYRPALGWPEAMNEIRTCAGSQFDPEVADVFLRYIKAEEAKWI